MNQLMRFKIRLPDYIQEFIIKLKVVNKKGNNKLKKIIVDALKLAMKYYQGSYIYMKENISEERRLFVRNILSSDLDVPVRLHLNEKFTEKISLNSLFF